MRGTRGAVGIARQEQSQTEIPGRSSALDAITGSSRALTSAFVTGDGRSRLALRLSDDGVVPFAPGAELP